MSEEKASFYSRDPGTSAEGVEEGAKEGAKKKPYEGIERRRQNRRQAKDRRGEVRFELDKDDRRKSHGRRQDDNSPDFW